MKQPIGGTFTILVYGKSTIPLSHNTNAADIQAAINEICNEMKIKEIKLFKKE